MSLSIKNTGYVLRGLENRRNNRKFARAYLKEKGFYSATFRAGESIFSLKPEKQWQKAEYKIVNKEVNNEFEDRSQTRSY